jgi:hypothetical protein
MTTDKIIARINAERTIPLDRYREEGAESRYEYLVDLADYNDIPLKAVLTLIDVLGPDEDFDGLVSMAEDLSMMGGLD